MRHRTLKLDFYQRDTLTVAPDLLGKFLVAPTGKFMITEVEAYNGLKDLASHACATATWPNGRRTPRTEVLFAAGGVWYVQLIYGMYWMLNIISGVKDHPSGVLIRGIKGYDGPGKLTRALGITGAYNSLPANQKTGLYIADGGIVVPKNKIKTAPRIGVDYAGPIWSKKPYRFILLDKQVNQ